MASYPDQPTHIPRIVALLVGLATIFSVEHLDFGNRRLFDLDDRVYVIGSVAILVFLLIPRLQHLRAWIKVVLCLTVYGLVRTVGAHTDPSVGAVLTYPSAIEMGVLFVFVLLTHRLGTVLREFERTYGKTRLADVRRSSRPLVSAAEQVLAAVQLSRRHGRPLGVVVFEPRIETTPNPAPSSPLPLQSGREGEKVVGPSTSGTALLEPDAAAGVDPNQITPVIHHVLRSTDILLEQSRQGFWVIVCPETDAHGLASVASHIRTALRKRGVPVALGSASFPDDALTFEELLQHALSQLIPRAAFEPSSESDSEPESLSSTVNIIDRKVPWLARIKPERRLLRGQKYLLAKRIVDLALIALMFPVWLPLFGLCALVVRVGSPGGPVFFLQDRTGKGGHRFRMIKFRTMVPNAEETKSEFVALNTFRWPDFKIDRDPRVTTVGHLLRRTSLDELPQLLNVIKGEMSLVGPRPTSFAPQTYDRWQTERLDIQPGITGLWQVVGRGTLEWDDRTRLDIAYAERRCLWLDLQILLRTVAAVIRRQGAR